MPQAQLGNRPQRPIPVRLSNFKGCNVSDPPETLPPSVGVSCKNFYFSEGRMVPRFGSGLLTAFAAPTVTRYRGCFAVRLTQSDYTQAYFLSAHGVTGGTDNIYNWVAGSLGTLATGIPGTNDNTIRGEFALFPTGGYGGMVVYGNGKALKYFVPDVAAISGVWRDAQITVPSAPTVADGGAGPLNGSYDYYVVHEDVETGALSNPSAVGSVSLGTGRAATVTLPGGGSTTYNQWVYRKGGASTSKRYVTSVSGATTTYLDVTADENLGEVLVTNRDPFPHCQILDVWRDRLLGAGSVTDDEFDMLYVSYGGDFQRCPLVTDLDDADDGFRAQVGGGSNSRITGIKAMGDLALVFTRNKAFLLSGDDPTTFQLTRAWGIGCVAHRTLQDVDGAMLWLGPEDVWLWAGQGRPIRVSGPIRKRIKAWGTTKGAAFSYARDGRYYLFCNDEVWVLDLKESGQGEDGKPQFAWMEITGWDFEGVSVLPEGVSGSSDEAGLQVFAIKGATAPLAHELEGASHHQDNGTNIALEWTSANIPPEMLEGIKQGRRMFRVRRVTLTMEDLRDGYSVLPVGADRALTLGLMIDTGATADESHALTVDAVADEEFYTYEGDVSSAVEGRNVRVKLTASAFMDNLKMYPAIHDLELLIVPVR